MLFAFWKPFSGLPPVQWEVYLGGQGQHQDFPSSASPSFILSPECVLWGGGAACWETPPAGNPGRGPPLLLGIWGKLRDTPPPPTEGPLDSAFGMLEPEKPRMKERLEGCVFTAFGWRAAWAGAGAQPGGWGCGVEGSGQRGSLSAAHPLAVPSL